MNANALEKQHFGTTADGVPVDCYTLRNHRGMTVRLLTYGAAVSELWVPDREGRTADVVLGFDRLAPYEDPAQNPYFGATVGRVAFRITGGQFTLDGKSHQLSLNLPPHHLHGGVRGFSRMVWNAEAIAAADRPAVRFSLTSPDGDQGYPGQLKAEVVYTLSGPDQVSGPDKTPLARFGRGAGGEGTSVLLGPLKTFLAGA
jgi:aldose 1-epimerase